MEVQVDSTADGNDGELVFREFGGMVEDDGTAAKVHDGHLDGRYGGEKLGVEVRDDGAAVKEHDGWREGDKADLAATEA